MVRVAVVRVTVVRTNVVRVAGVRATKVRIIAINGGQGHRGLLKYGSCTVLLI